MAIPSAITVVRAGQPGAPATIDSTMLAEFNKVVDTLRGLTAKLDADGTVTDTNYAALWTAADGASPAKLSPGS